LTRVPESAPIFAALGDPTRLEIVARLSYRGPQTVARLAIHSGVTRQAISKHVHVLEYAGLVHRRKQGRERLLELDTRRLEEARGYLNEISMGWDSALDRLRKFVEKKEKK
jgi:DNA-binding transcriptional ArsR family regulator